MEKSLVDAISAVGFPIVACILLAIAFYKLMMARIKAQDNKIDTMEINNQKDKENFFKELDNLHKENKEDKSMFQNAVRLFEQSVNEFKSIKDDVKDVKNDVEDIKDIVQFNTKNNEKTR